MSSRYVGAKNIGQKVMDLIVKKIPRKKKVSPDITKVKSTKDVKGSVKRTKSDEYVKRITTLDKADSKVKTGKQMMREGQKERKKMVDTGRAFQFKHSKSFHPLQPGDKDKYAANMKVGSGTLCAQAVNGSNRIRLKGLAVVSGGTSGDVEFINGTPESGTTLFKSRTIGTANDTVDRTIPSEGVLFDSGLCIKYTLETVDNVTIFHA